MTFGGKRCPRKFNSTPDHQLRLIGVTLTELDLLKQSLKSRGVQFPGRDSESLVPIFTPARTFSLEPELDSGVVMEPSIIAQYTLEQSKEILDVARNAVELLSTVLTSSPPQDVLKVHHFLLSYVLFYFAFFMKDTYLLLQSTLFSAQINIEI